MIEFQWRDEISNSLGQIKRPVAEVYVKDKQENWRALTMLVDSRADISIISRSFGELFGHNINKGRKITLKGIGETHLIAYIHTMEVLIGKHSQEIEIAIADKDDVPNVLGRRGLFDLFEIQFKNLKKATRFIRKTK